MQEGILEQDRTRTRTRIAAAFCAVCVALLALALFAPSAHADQTQGADRETDPSTANGNASILGEGTTNTLNSGRIWADKSVYADDTTIDGVDLSNDSDFLVIFSALGSSTSRVGAGFDGVPSSPIAEDSSLSYVDPLGEYMEPGSNVTLIQFGQSYSYAATSVTDTSIRYAPMSDQSIVNLSYGGANLSFKLSDIAIEARKDDTENRWVMNIDIPARALPLYLSILGFGTPDASGNQTLQTFTTNAGETSSLPLRITYCVGISQAAKQADGTLDFSKIADEYQASHIVQTDAGYALSFYSNHFDDPSALIAPDETWGNAIVKIAPAADNNFYYFQDHLTVYRNGTPGIYNGNPAIFGNVSNPITSLYEIQGSPQQTFYVVRNYYRKSGTGGLHNAYEVVAYSGSDLANAVCYYDLDSKAPADAPGTNVVVATDVGCPCMGNVAKFRTLKTANPTDTARYSYYGDFIIDPNVAGAFDIEAHYGNNGVMTVPYTASNALQLTGVKRVEVNGAVWSPTAADYGSFAFSVLPNRGNPQGDPVPASGVNATSTADGKILFDIGSYARPGVYSYIIRERQPAQTIPGLSYDSTMYVLRIEVRVDASGKLVPVTSILKNGVTLPDGQAIEFTNTYDTGSVSANAQGQVSLVGANIEKGMFHFILEPQNANGASGSIACPMPSTAQAENDESGWFSFGNITFSQAGDYVYHIRQNVPTNDPNYLYDTGTYVITYAVRHSATGPLYITTTIREAGSANDSELVAFENRVVTPTLVVTKTQVIVGKASGETVVVTDGDVIVYRITLANSSSVTVHDVLLYDEVPAGLILPDDLNANAQGPFLRNGRLYWIIAQLAGGESVTFEFTASVPSAPSATEWLNRANASYPDLLDANDVMTSRSPAVLARYDAPEASTPSTPAVVPPASASPADATHATITTSSVRTGDESAFWAELLIGLLAMFGIAACARAYRRTQGL